MCSSDLTVVALACSEPSPVRSGGAPTPVSSSTAAVVVATVAASTPATSTSTSVAATPAAGVGGVSPRNATYEVNGRPVSLKDGVLEVEAAPGSASKVTTRVFGNEATGDVNGDGQPDVALLITQSPGGSGTFFYAVVALKTATGYSGTNAVLLGDRIAPQTTRIVDGLIEVNYADRAPGEPMTARPSVGVTKRLRVTDGRLVEVAR